MRMNIPNSLTLMRIALIPVFIVAVYYPADWARQAAAGLFALAGMTDWLDGYLARKLNQQSAFGAFLDPVADKLMVAAALIVLVALDPRTEIVLACIIIIGREITISALREWMAELGERATVAVSWVGKFKTAAQMGAITFMLYQEPLFGFSMYQFGLYLLYIAAALTLWSMIVYLMLAWPLLTQEEK